MIELIFIPFGLIGCCCGLDGWYDLISDYDRRSSPTDMFLNLFLDRIYPEPPNPVFTQPLQSRSNSRLSIIQEEKRHHIN